MNKPKHKPTHRSSVIQFVNNLLYSENQSIGYIDKIKGGYSVKVGMWGEESPKLAEVADRYRKINCHGHQGVRYHFLEKGGQ